MSKLGRKREKDEYKPATVSARLTWEEYKKLKDTCEKLNMTTSEYIRNLIVKAKSPTVNLKRLKEKCEGLKAISAEINRIGNNINQIARHANTRRELDITILEKLVRIEEELNHLLFTFHKWLEEEVDAYTPPNKQESPKEQD